VSLRNGDGPNGAAGTTEAGGIVEFGKTNAPPIAAKPARPQELIAALAGLFPAVFVAEQWKPHRPLKRGIHNDLIERGVLLARECKVLRWYVSRRMYQVSLAAGGPRYDLDGHAVGEVTPAEAAGAQAVVAELEAKRARKAKAIADERTAARKAGKTAKTPVLTTSKTPVLTEVPREAQPVTTAPPAKSGLSLDGLRAAARARREAVR
jgi:sRNA-binding protein